MARDSIKLQLSPAHIAPLMRILEGAGHLGAVSTLDREAGLILLRSTAELLPALTLLLQNLPFPLTIKE
jgi:putative protease